MVVLSSVVGLGAVHCQHRGERIDVRAASASKDAGAEDPLAASLATLPPMPSRDDICKRVVPIVEPSAGAKPFERPDGLCKGDNGRRDVCGMAERYDFPPTPSDTCFVAESNIEGAAQKVRASALPRPISAPTGGSTSSPPPPPPASVATTPWDKKTSPRFAERVGSHLSLSEGERTMLTKNGFVVLGRKPVHSYVAAYHDVFQEELPLYVTADSILHAIFRSEDALLEGIERVELKKRVVELVSRLRAALRSVPRQIAAEDVDVYLTVAARLLDPPGMPSPAPSLSAANEALTADIAQKIETGTGIETVEMYGRKRAIDFSKYAPVGHYAGFRPGDLPAMGTSAATIVSDQYFRVMTWLSRHEWNLVTRGCQSSTPVDSQCSTDPTPREVRAALLVSELVDRAGVRPILDRFESVYGTFGGKRDDVPVASLRALVPRSSSQDPRAAEAVQVAIGEGGMRYAVTHPMPVFPGDHEGRLPAIATLIGARVAPDLDPVGSVMRSVYPEPLTANVFGALLGHDPRPREAWPAQGLDAAYAISPTLRAASKKGRSMYDAWMTAVLSLGLPPAGTVPTFFRTPAHANLRLNSALVGYGQIRHNFVLMSGSAYDSYGCEIPDAYVEPHLGVYEALLEYAERGKALGAKDRSTLDYFTRTSNVLRTLVAIVKHELEGKKLTPDEVRYLGMVTEYTPDGGYGGDSHGPPKRTGWYYDLFTDRGKLAEEGSDFVGEVATNAHSNYVYMLGADMARLGVFVVDTGGEPRLMVGPVASGYEARENLSAPRWTDASAFKKPHASSWSKSYTAPVPPEPAVEGAIHHCDDGTLRLFVRSVAPIDDSEVTLTDHHGDPVTARHKLRIGPAGTVLAVREGPPRPAAPPPSSASIMPFSQPRPPSPFSGMRLRIGAHREGARSFGTFEVTLGPSVYHASTGKDPNGGPETHIPERDQYRELEDFVFGTLPNGVLSRAPSKEPSP